MTEAQIALREAAAQFAADVVDWRELWSVLHENLVELCREEPLASDLSRAFEDWDNSVGDRRDANLDAESEVARRLAGVTAPMGSQPTPARDDAHWDHRLQN